jgi:hypothetical protein
MESFSSFSAEHCSRVPAACPVTAHPGIAPLISHAVAQWQLDNNISKAGKQPAGKTLFLIMQTLASFLAATTAAATPAIPPPATITSYSFFVSIFFSFSQ